MTDMAMNDEFPWESDIVPNDCAPEILEAWRETWRKMMDEGDCAIFLPPNWWTHEPQSDPYYKSLQHEQRYIPKATEHAFALCQREVNFCLNNEKATRVELETEMAIILSTWMASYTASAGLGRGLSADECIEQAGRMLPVLAPICLRSMLLLNMDSCENATRNAMAKVTEGIEELTEEQECLAEDYLEHFVPAIWERSFRWATDEATAEDIAVAWGRAVVRFLVSGILDDSDDELAREVAALDDANLPILAAAFLVVAATTTSTSQRYDSVYAPGLYAVLCGASDKDTGSPALNTPAGVVDLLRYEMIEEGVRYFASLPFRPGYEWHDRKNHIIVPNKSDEELLDHLLREGVLMPFYERVFQGCVRKDSYDTYEEAREQADEYEMRGARQLRVYHCPFCGRYHITHVRRYVSRDGVDEEKELERSIYRHGAHSRDFLLVAGAEFLKKNKKRIIFRIRQEWERRYGGRRYDRRRAA